MSEPSHTNHLVHETSLYLQQHAHNPVDWYPWGEEALERARRESKPILLSIGYSACHWCHVMAHESFEDEATAQLMNEHFINIKVDREERPDLDKIYQTAFQLMNRRAGGWPLTVFLTHNDQIPFISGTYFPKISRYQMPAFSDVLRRVSDIYRQHPQEIQQQNKILLEALRSETEASASATAEAQLLDKPLQMARDQLIQHFDWANGGFGSAPKFPNPTSVERLLRHWFASTCHNEPDPKAQAAALFGLRKMAVGGLYDHLGGGFYRYSVDAEWQIPHFEKMLYDNAALLPLYAQAWQMTQDALFRTVSEETAAWIMRDMQAPEGGYYATWDADSEGEEGKFYLWTREQVQALLSAEEYAVFAAAYSLEDAPNFEGQAWHLQLSVEIPDLVERLGMESAQLTDLLTSARRKLFESRCQRIHPNRDEKILTAWNGLMIRGMAIAGRCLDRADFITSAEQALDFVQTRLWQDGRLLAVHAGGKSRLNAYLDDYAFLIDGILELLQCRWRDGDLDFALELAEVLLAHFEDREAGGFLFTANDHERLISRPKPIHDDALPSGNAITAQVLLKLGHLTGRADFLDAAERALRWAAPTLSTMPTACNAMLTALEADLEPLQIIILRGTAATMDQWQQRCAKLYAPRRLTLAIPADAKLPAGLLTERQAVSAEVTAWVCTGVSCLPPITTLADLENELKTNEWMFPEE